MDNKKDVLFKSKGGSQSATRQIVISACHWEIMRDSSSLSLYVRTVIKLFIFRLNSFRIVFLFGSKCPVFALIFITKHDDYNQLH